MQVYRDQDALHRAVNEIRAVKSGVTALSTKARSQPHGAALESHGTTLLAQASQIEGALMQVNIKGSEANLNYPGMLNEQIYSFSLLLEDADTAPNQQEVETYASLHERLDKQLAAWNTLKATQVAAFCQRAQAAGISAVSKPCP